MVRVSRLGNSMSYFLPLKCSVMWLLIALSEMVLAFVDWGQLGPNASSLTNWNCTTKCLYHCVYIADGVMCGSYIDAISASKDECFWDLPTVA